MNLVKKLLTIFIYFGLLRQVLNNIIQKEKKNINYSLNQQNKVFQQQDDVLEGQYPLNGKIYRIGSLMYSANYLMYDQQSKLLKCQIFRNTSSHYFYFKPIQNKKYLIINVDSLKSISLLKFHSHQEIRFNPIKFNKDFLKFNQLNNEKEKIFYEQDQIWQLERDYETKEGFYIKTLNNQKLNVQMILSRYKQKIWSEINFQDKNQTWFIKQIQHNQLNTNFFYEEQITELYRNISFNLNKKYQAWSNFFDLYYQFSLVQQKLPKWLNSYDFQVYPSDLILGADKTVQTQGFHVNSKTFSTKIKPHCVKQHQIAYIWVGDKQLPSQYKAIVQLCKNNTKLLTMKEMEYYTVKWNQMFPLNKIKITDFTIRQIADILKKLYLYFESGMYADFDTEINQQCFQDIYTDEVIFTNYVPTPAYFYWIPQQNFMKVNTKLHPQIKKMIEAQIQLTDRWQQCRQRQCLIVNCQRHLYDRTYFKGYQ